MTVHDQSNQVPDPGTRSMHGQASNRIAAFMDQTVSAGASSQEVATVVAEAFQRIGQALVPIIGQGGLAALYKRTLHLSRPMCPWLPVVPQGAPSTMDLAALTTGLATQTAANAAAAGTELLQVFHTLLTSLIGESLTERLLRPVGATFLSGPSARETNP